jgi:hypothetical protein
MRAAIIIKKERVVGFLVCFWVAEGGEAGMKELRLKRKRERLSVFEIIGDERINKWVVGSILALLLMVVGRSDVILVQ